MPGSPSKSENVFLFLPNLLGFYSRWLQSGLHSSRCRLLCICYGASQILDAVDGYVARAYGQATVFGAVLDQVTDRLSTVGILLLDSVVYPAWYRLFALVLVCDLGGHWIHTFASMLAGAESHKRIPAAWPVLKLYYESKGLMFLCHASNEFVWLALFVLQQYRNQDAAFIYTIKMLLWPTCAFCILKNVTNLTQLIFGAQVLASIDVERRRPAHSSSASDSKAH